MAFLCRHFYNSRGSSFNAREANGAHICRIEYGPLRTVNASAACNYSYREFWF
jgi:hypothetical protein